MERLKLAITSVKEPRKVGQGEVLQFFATGPDNKTLNYSVWDKSSWSYIKKGAVLDCEVETKISDKKDPGGENYVARNIVQLFIDGKPVIEKKQSPGRSWGKSAEELRAERASTESIAAIQTITALEIAKVAVKPELISLRDTWLRKALSSAIIK